MTLTSPIRSIIKFLKGEEIVGKVRLSTRCIIIYEIFDSENNLLLSTHRETSAREFVTWYNVQRMEVIRGINDRAA